MIEIESFTARHIGLDEGDISKVVEEATKKARVALREWSGPDNEVKVISTSTQLVTEGNYAAYTITLVVDIIPSLEMQPLREWGTPSVEYRRLRSALYKNHLLPC